MVRLLVSSQKLVSPPKGVRTIFFVPSNVTGSAREKGADKVMSAKIQNCVSLFERKESLVQMCEAHKHFPFKTSPSTVQRWIRRGVSTPHGHFKLETAVLGSKRVTSLEAIERFWVVQQGQFTPQSNAVSVPINNGMTATERKREMKRLGLRSQGESKPDKPKSVKPKSA